MEQWLVSASLSPPRQGKATSSAIDCTHVRGHDTKVGGRGRACVLVGPWPCQAPLSPSPRYMCSSLPPRHTTRRRPIRHSYAAAAAGPGGRDVYLTRPLRVLRVCVCVNSEEDERGYLRRTPASSIDRFARVVLLLRAS